MKKFKSSAVLAALTALAMLALSARVLLSQNAQDLYQKALSHEKIQGNLEQAIAIYQKVIAGAGTDRALAARAQYHIGLCYEKLGATEAEKAFRKVIEQYPEQKESVSAANERLALLTKSRAVAQNANNGLVLRQVSVPEGQPSPDGKYIAYTVIHNDHYDIELYDVGIKTKRRITNLDSFRSSFISSLAWSPNGDRIAFVLDHGERVCCRGKLGLVNSDGSNFKIVYDNQEKAIDEIAGWLPDKSAVIVSVLNPDDSRSICSLSFSEGMLREIRNVGKITDVTLSPDGRFIAFDQREGSQWDIRVISTDGKIQGYLVQHPALDILLGWTPDSQFILFSSDRSGVRSIWAQAVGDGKPTGSPMLIQERGTSFTSLGFTQDGDFYFAESINRSDVYLAQVDLATGRTLKAPESVDTAYTGNKFAPTWSGDGSELAYLLSSGRDSGRLSLQIHPMTTGKEREYLLDLMSSLYMQPPRWSLDGKSIYIYGSKPIGDGKIQRGVFRIEVQSGHSEFVSSANTGAFSADGSFTVLSKTNEARSLTERKDSLFRKDVKTGEEMVVVAGQIGQLIGGVQVSLDGKWIGYRMMDYGDPQRTDAFYVVPAVGGNVLQLAPSAEKSGMIAAFFFWGPGESVLFDRRYYNEGGDVIKRDLWYMPTFDSKQARKLDLNMLDISGLSFHPDGKTIAFTSQVRETKVWVMENYLPAKK